MGDYVIKGKFTVIVDRYIRQIRQLHEEGYNYIKIAELYHIPIQTVREIIAQVDIDEK